MKSEESEEYESYEVIDPLAWWERLLEDLS